MSDRALLTDRERAVLRGDVDDVEDLAQYQAKIRSRLNRRLEQLREDYELIDDLGLEHADAIRELVCGSPDKRLRKLEQRVRELEREQR
jgi:hypothetical protein